MLYKEKHTNIFIYYINPSSPLQGPLQGSNDYIPSIIEDEPRFDDIDFDSINVMNNPIKEVWGDNLLKGPVIDFT